MGLVNKCRNALCVFAGMRGLWSTRWDVDVEMHLEFSLAQARFYQPMLTFVFSLALDVFGQHMLRYILCPEWHGRGTC